jgi:hypothetical protein
MLSFFSWSPKPLSIQVTLRLVVALVMSFALSASSSSSSSSAAAGAGPGWAIKSVALPTNFSMDDNGACETESNCDGYLVTATNVGTTPSTGTIMVKDTLPEGIAFRNIEFEGELEPNESSGGSLNCVELPPRQVQCEYAEPVPPGGMLAVQVNVLVEPGAPPTVENKATVEGGEAAPAATSQPSSVANTVNGEAPSFGLQDFSIGVYAANGASDTQAGDHPGALTTTIDFTSDFFPVSSFHYRPVQDPKNTIVDLPLGFAGDPLAAGQCPESALYRKHCPTDSRVGVVTIIRSGQPTREPVYNMIPEAGYPALFGFVFDGAAVFMRARVLPSSSGYVLSISVPNIARSVNFRVTGLSLTFFGDPNEQNGGLSSSAAFFTNPADCATGPLKARLEMDSWVNPEQWVTRETTVYEANPSQAVSGCNMLQFNPTIGVAPETTQADTPSGYEVDLKVPQAPNVWPDLATPTLRDATVTLPEGVSVSPGAADGLVGCQAKGPEGINLGNEDTLSHEVQEGEEPGPDGLPHAARGHCSPASQIGTVKIMTPLLPDPLEGHVYLAQPQCGGEGQPACTEADATNGNLFGVYIEAEGSSVIIKLKGNVSANPVTGQLTARFEENPQLPFSEFKLQLKGGPRAPLANPQICGETQTTSVLTPWSAPESGPPATPFSTFAVTGCASSLPFAPAFLAQTTTPIAGAFSPFTLTLSRHDGEQDLSGITVQTPPGLLGMLSQVQLCPEPQASKGTCGPGSLIGHTQAAAGAGSHPFWVPGDMFLTGPYKGAPFGLSIVVPAVAGPFNLGNLIVRAAIGVNPNTAALTVTSDPLPQIVDGVPLRLQTVNVTVDKPGFMFNPTNCSQQQITGTVTGAQGASTEVSSPFAVAGCANLPFKPKFTVLTQAKTTKAKGAYLHVKVVSGSGQANIAKVKVELPKQLPSRLTTLQKACLDSVFNANPAMCPAASLVGSGTAVTPVLAHPLTGPAYLVSHGNVAFPDLVFVLQGEGITLHLVGNTNIKKGITSETFNSVPDAPISTFDAVFPKGPHSVLATNLPAKAKGSLCFTSLVMPTTITGQNSAQVTQATKVTVTGCPKHRARSKVKQKRAQ